MAANIISVQQAEDTRREMLALRKQNAKMARALRVIHTWAAFDASSGEVTALVPATVMEACRKALTPQGQ